MGKQHVFGMALFALMFAATLARADIISDNQGININSNDIDALLKPAPENAQLGLLKARERFISKLEEMYVSKAVAEQQKNVPFNAVEQADFDKMLVMFHFQRKYKQLTTENLPDFDPLAKVHYDANKADFVTPEMVAAEHILIDTKNRSEKEAIKLTNEILAKLKKGSDFGELAEKYSDDHSAKTNKGKLGLFRRGQMIKEFEDIAFNSKLGEFSKPTKTSFGYHIIRVYEHKPSVPRSFEDVKDEIISKIKKEYVQNRLNEYYEKIKKDNEMKIDDKEVDAYIADKTTQLEAKLKPAAAPVAESAAK